MGVNKLNKQFNFYLVVIVTKTFDIKIRINYKTV